MTKKVKMHGFPIFLMIICCHVLTLSGSDIVLEDEEQRPANTNINLNHRRLPLFPMKNMKFVVSPEPVTSIWHHHDKNIRKKMTLMPHFTPKYTVENTIASTKKPKRKPLMKLRTFTMKSHIEEELHSITNDMINEANFYKERVKAAEVPSTEFVTKANEDRNDKVHSLTENNVKRLPNLIKNAEVVSTTAMTTLTTTDSKIDNNVVAEEDRNEFIYIGSANEKEDEDMETTTNYYDYTTITEKKSRGKRNDNIIIEENIASTTSALKRYTGRDTRLNNNFYFKNINS